MLLSWTGIGPSEHRQRPRRQQQLNSQVCPCCSWLTCSADATYVGHCHCLMSALGDTQSKCRRVRHIRYRYAPPGAAKSAPHPRRQTPCASSTRLHVAGAGRARSCQGQWINGSSVTDRQRSDCQMRRLNVVLLLCNLVQLLGYIGQRLEGLYSSRLQYC